MSQNQAKFKNTKPNLQSTKDFINENQANYTHFTKHKSA
jgi:hypothetical protein